MFNTKFLGKRKYAVYKQDGTPWTQEEYSTVITLFEGPGANDEQLCSSHLKRQYITDEIWEKGRALYYLWSHYQHEQELKSFTKISYEELLKQSKMPLLKRRKNDSRKNETPTTPSK